MRPFHFQDAPKKRRRHPRKILKCALSRGRPTSHYFLVALRCFTKPRGMKHRSGQTDRIMEGQTNEWTDMQYTSTDRKKIMIF